MLISEKTCAHRPRKPVSAAIGRQDLNRQLKLRQIEAFKAMVEQGTASRAAEVLYVTQPAISKLLVHLEEETGLILFERIKGRLTPTEQGMRLYAEVDRVFAGLRQLEEAVAIIQRKSKQHFAIGVLPALSGAFVRRVTTMFLSNSPNVHPAVHTRASSIVSDRVAMGQMDVGLTTKFITNPNLIVTPILEQPLVCIMPVGHRLSALTEVTPEDLRDEPFVSYTTRVQAQDAIDAVFRSRGMELNIAMECETVPTLCEFVSAGLGVSLTHPLCVIDMAGRLVIRRFRPDIMDFHNLCHAKSPRSMALVEEFKRCAFLVAQAACEEMRQGLA